MQYDLTEEQRMLQDMVRRLAKEQVEPGAAKRDIEGNLTGRWWTCSGKTA